MKTIALLLFSFALATAARAALKPGDHLTPYEIKNVATGKQYCQVCAYGGLPAKLVAFGSLKDEAFWADLKKLQALQEANRRLGVFAQIIDSKDSDAIRAVAKEHGITFPVVVAIQRKWDEAYQVRGVSRTIYYAQKDNEIVWTGVGIDERAKSELESRIKKDIGG